MRPQNPLAAAIFAALLCGAVAGLAFPDASARLAIVSDIFLRLIRSIIAPLLFGVLVAAIAEAGGAHALGRIGWRALLYFEVTTTFALLTGWAAITLPDLGSGFRSAALQTDAAPAPTRSLASLIEESFPASIIDAMARGDILQILIFCLILGAAAGAAGKKAEPLIRFASALTSISFEFTRIVMWLAPAAIFAAIASTVARSSNETIASLGGFVAAAWIAQCAFLILAIGGSLVLAKLPFRDFIRAVEEPFLVAFATTSSAAAIPKTLDAMERLHVPRAIYGVVTPLSVSFNLNGSCIHLAMCAFFAAHAAGIALTPAQQAIILLTLKLTSKGVAGIPRANFIILSGLFSTFGLPASMLTILLGIDALIDPVRTSVNVLSHCAASPLIARWTPAFLPSVPPQNI